MSKKQKIEYDDSVLTDRLSKMTPDEVRLLMRNELYDFPTHQFIMEHVTGPVDDDDDVFADEPFVQVTEAPGKGRILLSKIDFQPGDVILRERAFAVGSWSDYHCPECCLPHKAAVCQRFCAKYGTFIREHIDQIEEILADEELIGELDRARLFMKCVYWYNLYQDSPAVQQFLTLQCIKHDECIATMQRVMSRAMIQKSKIFHPDKIKDYAYIMGILNCNSHEIEHLGSGIFLKASMMEHSCLPNCNFVTENNIINIICLQPIKAGDALSIDYAHAFYQPTSVRQTQHLQDYGFLCTCIACTQLPDRTRSFVCPLCPNGIVCPAGDSTNPTWICLHCSQTPTTQHIQTFLQVESKYYMPLCINGEDEEDEIYQAANTKRIDIDDISKMIHEKVLHESHYLIFWSMIANAFRLTNQANNMSIPHVGKGKHSKKHKQAAEKALAQRKTLCIQADLLWQSILKSLELHCLPYHPEKVIYQDYLSQVRVLCKDIAGAQASWSRAYEISRICNGHYTRNTKLMLKLSKHTPRTVEAMQFQYKNILTVLDKLSYENDAEGKELLRLFAESTIEQEEEAKKEIVLPNQSEESEEESEEEEDIFAAQRKTGFLSSAESYLQTQGFVPQPQPPQEQAPVQPQEPQTSDSTSADSATSKQDTYVPFSQQQTFTFSGTNPFTLDQQK